jgi:uncharacterized lipoprotein NlpE involved in copper resistance
MNNLEIRYTHGGHVGTYLFNDAGGLVASLESGDQSSRDRYAAFIVRACNSHYQLLAALEACKFAIRFGLEKELKPYDGAWGNMLNAINAALSKAKG